MIKTTHYIFFIILNCVAMLADAQDFSLFEKQWFVQNGDTLPYRILLPKDYDPAKKYPLVLFLHGRGESGDDNEKQLVHGGKLFLHDSIRSHYPAIIVFPQCSPKSYWSNVQTVMTGSKSSPRNFYFVRDGEPSTAMKLVLSLVDNLFLRYPIQKQQAYVMGLSMGGMGTFEIVRRKPGLFTAAIAICGGANPATATQLSKTKHWWIFHGEKDDIVSPEFSKQMAGSLTKSGAEVKLTLYPTANHNSWDSAFAEKDLLPWLFSKHK